jgi:hypothetical protein
MSFARTAFLEVGELVRELTLSLDSCIQLKLEMALAGLAMEGTTDLNALIWLPPYVSFWVQGNSPLLKFNSRTGKYEPFGSHL